MSDVAALDGRRLAVVGPFRGPSGYDRHTREFVRHLVGLGVDVHLTHLDGWSTPVPDDMRDHSLEELNNPNGATTLVSFAMPTQVMPRPGFRNVNYTMFEAERIPPAWVDQAYRCDLVVVPTSAARRAWIDSGVDSQRVRTAPLGVDGEFFRKPVPALPLHTRGGRRVADFGTRFLHIGEVRPRKNQIGLLSAWLHATSADDDAVLIMKCPAVEHVVAHLIEDVLDVQRRTGRALAGAAPVVLMPALLSDEEMRGLYAAATHYISMSCGEGWDQVMMEAAISGLHLIAPRHTAYVEYLTDGDAEFIPAELAPARFPGRIGFQDEMFFEGLRWWPPDQEAAAEIIRGAIDGRLARQAPPSTRLAAEYTWDAAARRLLEAVDLA
jgi:glycosyltransferase involved in cell wall biosynthesis